MATDAELATVRERLFGLVDETRIARVDIVRPAGQVAERFLALTDLTPTVADALDELGVGGVIAGSDLIPRCGTARIAGPAITIRYAREGGNVGARLDSGEAARLADRDLYAIGIAGDVAVFDCGRAAEASVLGGLSAQWATHLGMAGCVIDGAVRDLESIQTLGFPVWSRAITPRTGRHRMAAIELNGTVSVAGIAVSPGDYVVADSSGTCVIPCDRVDAVLASSEEAEASEHSVISGINGGLEPRALNDIHPANQW